MRHPVGTKSTSCHSRCAYRVAIEKRVPWCCWYIFRGRGLAARALGSGSDGGNYLRSTIGTRRLPQGEFENGGNPFQWCA